MKFLDLFSGIGGFRLGLERAGHTCVGHVEIDKFAQQSYNAIHKPREDEFFHADITTIGDDELQDLKQRGIDIITGGFPCQSFSIAGHRKGFEDTRGTLFFDIAKLAKEIQPKYLFLENVKGLLNHDKGDTFEVILRTLDEIGYDAEWQVLNSKHFGVPQNRERVFIIGHLRGSGGGKVFPFGRKGESTTTEPGEKTKEIKVVGRVGNGIHDSNRVIDPTGIAQTMQARDYKDPIKVMVKETTEPGERVSQKVVSFDRKNGIGDELEIAHTLNASDWRGLNRNQTQNAVMVKEATKQGYAIAEPGDSINLEQPNSKTRRGRVGKGIAQTLTTSCNQATIVEDNTTICINSKDENGVQPSLNDRVYSTDGVMPAITTSPFFMGNVMVPAVLRPVRTDYGKKIRKQYESGEIEESRQNMTRLEPRDDGISNTITTVQKDNLLKDNFRIRKLTPKECWRLQGFPDWSFERARAVGVSDSQLYKQAGNSVTVNVVYEIAKRLK